MNLPKSEQTRLKTNYGPWAVVTGASSGIGLELAERLAEAGLNLVLNARRGDILEKLAADLRTRFGIEVRVAAADLSTPVGTQEVINATRDLDVGLLAANAGYGTSGLFIDSEPEAEINMLRVNCESLLILTRHFTGIFKKRKRSGILLMSSIVAFQGVPYAAHYAATKAYVQSLAEALAIELRPCGIDVLAPAPGPVHSGFAGRAGMQMGMALTPADIGVPILKALGRRSTVLPGWLSKVLVLSLRSAPRWVRIRIMRGIMKGMVVVSRKS